MTRMLKTMDYMSLCAILQHDFQTNLRNARIRTFRKKSNVDSLIGESSEQEEFFSESSNQMETDSGESLSDNVESNEERGISSGFVSAS